MPLVVILVMAALGVLMGAQTELQIVAARTWQEKMHTLAVADLGHEIVRYYRLTGNLPEDAYGRASLAVLAQTPGFEQTRSESNPYNTSVWPTTYQFAAITQPSNSVSDGQFLYRRAAVFVDPSAELATTTGSLYDLTPYLSANANVCDSAGDFYSGLDWCGDAHGYWWRFDERELIHEAMIAQRARQQRLLQKIAEIYDTFGSFPQPPSGTVATLAALANVSATATNCSGTAAWRVVSGDKRSLTLDCSDLFSVWGTPVTYNWLNAKHIVLVARSPILDANGNPLHIATDLQL